MDILKRCHLAEVAAEEAKASRHRLALAMSVFLGLPVDADDVVLLKALAERTTPPSPATSP